MYPEILGSRNLAMFLVFAVYFEKLGGSYGLKTRTKPRRNKKTLIVEWGQNTLYLLLLYHVCDINNNSRGNAMAENRRNSLP